MIDFTFIDRQDTLAMAAAQWNAEKVLAIDLECENNLHHYGVYISLIQISSKTHHWVIDVLALGRITPLIDVLQNPKIQKIFHDVTFDFRVLHKQFHCQPRNVLDTQMAALLLGKEKIGLGSLLEEYFDIQKERKFQRVDWTRRPLSNDMLAYAVKDTAYLLQLKEKLCSELKKKKRFEWLRQESDFLEKVDFTYTQQGYLDVGGVKSMSPQERGRFHVLFNEREKLARKVNLPVYKVCTTKQLLSFAQHPPRSIKAWKFLKRVHPQIKRNAERWFALVSNAKQEEYRRPVKEKLPRGQYEYIKKLTAARNVIGNHIGIKPHLIMNNDQIYSLVTQKNLKSLRSWQRDLVKDHKLVKEILSQK